MDIGVPGRSRPARLSLDRVSGALLVILGLAIGMQGFGYGTGSLTRMGSGFVPVVLGTALALTGLAIALTAETATGESTQVPGGGPYGASAGVLAVDWRGWACILGSVLLFVVLGSHGGLILAAFASVTLAALGDRNNSLRDALLLAAAVTAAGVAIFSYGLGMSFPLFVWD